MTAGVAAVLFVMEEGTGNCGNPTLTRINTEVGIGRNGNQYIPTSYSSDATMPTKHVMEGYQPLNAKMLSAMQQGSNSGSWQQGEGVDEETEENKINQAIQIIKTTGGGEAQYENSEKEIWKY